MTTISVLTKTSHDRVLRSKRVNIIFTIYRTVKAHVNRLLTHLYAFICWALDHQHVIGPFPIIAVGKKYLLLIIMCIVYLILIIRLFPDNIGQNHMMGLIII